MVSQSCAWPRVFSEAFCDQSLAAKLCLEIDTFKCINHWTLARTGKISHTLYCMHIHCRMRAVSLASVDDKMMSSLVTWIIREKAEKCRKIKEEEGVWRWAREGAGGGRTMKSAALSLIWEWRFCCDVAHIKGCKWKSSLLKITWQVSKSQSWRCVSRRSRRLWTSTMTYWEQQHDNNTHLFYSS